MKNLLSPFSLQTFELLLESQTSEGSILQSLADHVLWDTKCFAPVYQIEELLAKKSEHPGT